MVSVSSVLTHGRAVRDDPRRSVGSERVVHHPFETSGRLRIAPHTHPADEHLTIISGTFEIGLGEKFDAQALQPLPAGSYAMMAKNSPHFARARGETVIQVNAMGPLVFNYVNPADDPTKR